VENVWRTCGERVENVWRTGGERVENGWRTGGPEGSLSPKIAGKRGFASAHEPLSYRGREASLYYGGGRVVIIKMRSSAADIINCSGPGDVAQTFLTFIFRDISVPARIIHVFRAHCDAALRNGIAAGTRGRGDPGYAFPRAPFDFILGIAYRYATVRPPVNLFLVPGIRR
jgi:hypothetical protein